MKKKVIVRALLGFPLGVFIGYTITILSSAIFAQGYYAAVVPALIEECGSEIAAVILQYVLAGILGAACAASSVVWKIENWSFLRQTVIHFLIISFSMLPIAYFTHWMEHSLLGILSYFGIFIGAYAVIWIILFIVWKKKINAMNRKIQEGHP